MQNTFDNWEGAGEYLEHYGVLGMKWGIRKDPKRAYEKAMDRKHKLDMRAAKGSVRGASLKARSAKLEAKKLKAESKLAIYNRNLRQDRYMLDQLTKEGKNSNREGTASYQWNQMFDKDTKRAQKYQARIDKTNAKMDKLKLKQSKAAVFDAKTALKAAKWTDAMLNSFGSLDYNELAKKYGWTT